MQLYERTEMKLLHFIKDSMQLIGLILTGYHSYFFFNSHLHHYWQKNFSVKLFLFFLSGIVVL